MPKNFETRDCFFTLTICRFEFWKKLTSKNVFSALELLFCWGGGIKKPASQAWEQPENQILCTFTKNYHTFRELISELKSNYFPTCSYFHSFFFLTSRNTDHQEIRSIEIYGGKGLIDFPIPNCIIFQGLFNRVLQQFLINPLLHFKIRIVSIDHHCIHMLLSIETKISFNYLHDIQLKV